MGNPDTIPAGKGETQDDFTGTHGLPQSAPQDEVNRGAIVRNLVHLSTFNK